MRETISEAAPKPGSTVLFGLYVLLIVGLLVVTFDFVVEVFTDGDTAVLGMDLAAGFALIAVLLYVYYRMFVPHRFMIERDEDLW